MTLSVCYMVKNEAELLASSLVQLYGCVDEIIVVNNGSSDHTKDVALRYGCKVIDFDEDDFDKGRNVYLSHATQPWILILDADEKMTKHNVLELKEQLADIPANTMGILLPRYEYTGHGRWASTMILRVIRNHLGITYTNRFIHASPGPSIKDLGGEMGELLIPIQHFDILYMKRASVKREKYRHKLKEDLKNYREDPHAHYFLGMEYTVIGQYEVAEYYYQKALQIDLEYKTNACLFYAYHKMLFREYKAAKLLIQSFMSYSSLYSLFSEQAHLILSEVAVQEDDYQEAIRLHKKILKKNPKAPHTHLNLAALYDQQQPDMAIWHITEAIKNNELLLDHQIYGKGDSPNLFQHQTAFLSITRTVFEHLSNSYSSLSKEDKSRLKIKKFVEDTLRIGESIHKKNYL